MSHSSLEVNESSSDLGIDEGKLVRRQVRDQAGCRLGVEDDCRLGAKVHHWWRQVKDNRCVGSLVGHHASPPVGFIALQVVGSKNAIVNLKIQLEAHLKVLVKVDVRRIE